MDFKLASNETLIEKYDVAKKDSNQTSLFLTSERIVKVEKTKNSYETTQMPVKDVKKVEAARFKAVNKLFILLVLVGVALCFSSFRLLLWDVVGFGVVLLIIGAAIIGVSVYLIINKPVISYRLNISTKGIEGESMAMGDSSLFSKIPLFKKAPKLSFKDQKGINREEVEKMVENLGAKIIELQNKQENI